MIAHIYAVSFEMALIALVLILIVAILYFGFRPGDCFLMLLTPMAFMMKIPYAVPLLVGLGGSLASVIPVGCGVFIYYLIMYVKQNAGVLTNDTSVDIVQKYSQIIKSVTFNKTMMVMIATCAAGILVVYLIRRLSLNYAWSIAIVAGCVDVYKRQTAHPFGLYHRAHSVRRSALNLRSAGPELQHRQKYSEVGQSGQESTEL